MKTRQILALAAILVLPTASRAWISGGVPVSAALDDQDDADAAPDGAGGVYVVWTDRRDPIDGPDIYIQRLAPDGSRMWALDGIPVCDDPGKQEFPRVIASAGAAIVVWYDDRATDRGVRLQRVGTTGLRLWTAGGVELYTTPVYLPAPFHDIAPDGANGAIVTWTDSRNGDLDVYAQRVDDLGVKLWEADGVKVGWGPGDQHAQAIVTDGSGGAIMAWRDDDGPDQDLYVQRVNAPGLRQWGDGRVLTASIRDQTDCRMVADGTGGAIAAWVDYLNNPSPVFDPSYADILGQHVNSIGLMLWSAGGIPLSNVGGAQKDIAMVSNELNGAFVVFEDHRHGFTSDIYIQSVNGAGTAFSDDGVAVCSVAEDQFDPSIAADGVGGAVVSWTDQRMGERDVYVQRVRYDGARLWTWGGAPVCDVSADQEQSVVVRSPADAFVVAWTDSRDGDEDVYAMTPTDTLGTPTAVHGARPARLAVVGSYPNPFTSDFRLDFELDSPATVAVDIFDAAGRRVSGSSLGSFPDGAHSASIAPRDERGAPLASGVYFCRVRAGGESVTRKLVVVR